jgi:hypothetical protein
MLDPSSDSPPAAEHRVFETAYDRAPRAAPGLVSKVKGGLRAAIRHPSARLIGLAAALALVSLTGLMTLYLSYLSLSLVFATHADLSAVAMVIMVAAGWTALVSAWGVVIALGRALFVAVFPQSASGAVRRLIRACQLTVVSGVLLVPLLVTMAGAMKAILGVALLLFLCAPAAAIAAFMRMSQGRPQTDPTNS